MSNGDPRNTPFGWPVWAAATPAPNYGAGNYGAGNYGPDNPDMKPFVLGKATPVDDRFVRHHMRPLDIRVTSSSVDADLKLPSDPWALVHYWEDEVRSAEADRDHLYGFDGLFAAEEGERIESRVATAIVKREEARTAAVTADCRELVLTRRRCEELKGKTEQAQRERDDAQRGVANLKTGHAIAVNEREIAKSRCAELTQRLNEFRQTNIKLAQKHQAACDGEFAANTRAVELRDEVERLRAALARNVESGRPSLIPVDPSTYGEPFDDVTLTLSGAPGAGKTVLMQQLVYLLGTAGHVIVRGESIGYDLHSLFLPKVMSALHIKVEERISHYRDVEAAGAHRLDQDADKASVPVRGETLRFEPTELDGLIEALGPGAIVLNLQGDNHGVICLGGGVREEINDAS